jgi:hypothetical protein
LSEPKVVYEVVVAGRTVYRVFDKRADPDGEARCAAGRHAETRQLLVEGDTSVGHFWWCACGKRRRHGLAEPGQETTVPADDYLRWLTDTLEPRRD